MSVEARHPCLNLQPVLYRCHLGCKIRRERGCASADIPASCCAKLNNGYGIFVLNGLLSVATRLLKRSLPVSRRRQRQKARCGQGKYIKAHLCLQNPLCIPGSALKVCLVLARQDSWAARATGTGEPLPSKLSCLFADS